MNSGDLKRTVQAAVASEWEGFVCAHPRLASVIDESLVVDAAVEGLSEDVEYQETMADAVAMGTAAVTMSEFVSRWVRKWMKRLV